jgi:hypothetical protein
MLDEEDDCQIDLLVERTSILGEIHVAVVPQRQRHHRKDGLRTPGRSKS